MDDLNTLVPEPVVVEITGNRIEITPLRVGEFPAMLRAIRPFAEQLAGEPDWLALLAGHGESLLDALALACRRPREWVDGLDLDDALQLVAAVFEVNADFFVQRLAPAVQHAAAQVNGRLRGAMPSTDSSAPGTASPTS